MRLVALLVVAASFLLLGAQGAFAATGYHDTEVNLGSGIGSDPGQFKLPQRAAVDQDNGNVYVVDAANDRVQVFDSGGAYLTAITGLDDPFGIAIDQDASPIAVYVSNAGNGRIVKLGSNGAATPVFTPDPAFTSPSGATVGDFHSPLAVDPGSGDLLLADRGADVVRRYGADGTAKGTFDGSGSPDGTFAGLEDIAASPGQIVVVDSSGGPAVDGNPSRVLRFSTAGAYQSTLRPLQAQGDGLVAVDPNNSNVIVGDVRGFSSRVHVFAADGKRLTTISVSSAVSLTGLAVDGATTGNLYASAHDPLCEGSCGITGARTYAPAELLAAPTIGAVTEIGIFSARFTGAVDPDGEANTTASFEHSTDGENWNVMGTHDGSTDPGLDGGNDQVSLTEAVSLSQGTTYFVRLTATGAGGPVSSESVQFTTEPAVQPTIALAEVGATSAQFTGTVNPNGQETLWRLEYSDDEGANWYEMRWQTISAGSGDVAINQTISGLTPNSKYQVRLLTYIPSLGYQAGAGPISVVTTTAAPAVQTRPATQVTDTSAWLNSLVNAGGLDTDYYFEFGTDTSYGSSASPTKDGDAGSGGVGIPRAAILEGLKPNTTYHYRIVAQNSAGTSKGADMVFTTAATTACPNSSVRVEQHTTQLGECRAFEVVSPQDKNGLDINGGESVRGSIVSSPDGKRVAFVSHGSFAGSAVAAVPNYYLAERGDQNWATSQFNEPFDSTGIVSPDGFWELGKTGGVVDVSDDLSEAIINTNRPLTPGAEPGAFNLYRRDAHGNFELLTPNAGTLLEQEKDTDKPPILHAVTDNFEYRLIGTAKALTPNAPEDGQLKLYLSGRGAPTLVSVDPAGKAMPEVRPAAFHPVSEDGSTVFFTSTINNDRRVDLYMWKRGEGSTLIAENIFNTGIKLAPLASADGSRVLYYEENGGSEGSGAPSGVKLLHVDTGAVTDLGLDSTAGFVAASDDLSHLYLEATSGSNLPDEPLYDSYLMRSLYHWHEGEFSFVTGSLGVGPGGWNTHRLAEPDYFGANGDAELSPDGTKFVYFQNADWADRAAGQVYLYDSITDGTECISCPKAGLPTESSGLESTPPHIGSGYPVKMGQHHRNMLADGRVFFDTNQALVPYDTNGVRDVYGWDDGNLSLISSGTNSFPAFMSEADESGSNVYFVTRGQLLSRDRDGLSDLYTARVGGGFAEPPPNLAPCQGDECQGPQSPPPAGVSPQTSNFTGPGNPNPPGKCARGKVRKGGSCVKKKKSRAKKRGKRQPKRAANGNRGANR